MKYKRCPRCELNYVPWEDSLCGVCSKELAGQYDADEDDTLFDMCPYCEKNRLPYGAVRCPACEQKQADAAADA